MAEMQVSPPFFDRATQGSECKLTEFSYAFVDDDSLGETATSLTRNGRPRDRQSALFVATGEGVAGDGAVDAVRRRAQDAGRVALGGPDQQRTDRSKRAIRERYRLRVGRFVGRLGTPVPSAPEVARSALHPDGERGERGRRWRATTRQRNALRPRQFTFVTYGSILH